ncbi:MAG: hypothetical protein AB7T06_38035 [Kofleriaceae bacterium]
MRTYSLTSDDVRVLAFARGWSPNTEPRTQLELLRLRVMEVGVELDVVSDRGVWIFGVDGCLDFVDRLAADVPMSATMMQANRDNDVYLIDDGAVVRIAHDGSLVDAITGVGELLAMKRRVIEAPQHTTMPNGLFKPVFETSYATDVEVVS